MFASQGNRAVLSGCFLFVCFAHYAQFAVDGFVQKVECHKNWENFQNHY